MTDPQTGLPARLRPRPVSHPNPEPEEFSEFYDQNWDDVRSYVHNLDPHSDYENIAGEAFAKTLNAWESLTGSRRAWVYRVARNELRSVQRRSARAHHLELPPAPLADAQQRQELRELLKALDELPPALRETVYLAVRGLNIEQIADVMELSRRTVSTYLSRARRRLGEDADEATDTGSGSRRRARHSVNPRKKGTSR